MKISLIAAVAQNGVIGNNNDLIWHLSDDLKRFKKLTSGHHILLGRKNYESIARPLPNRTSVIITRQKELKIEGCLVVHSFEEALAVSKNDDEIFIIGGAEIYRLAIESGKLTNLYMTFLDRPFEGDTIMPEINYDSWRTTFRSEKMIDEKSGIGFYYKDYCI